MSPELSLKRLRLETDRTLRTRSFISRALRDDLPDQAHAQLLAQLKALLGVLGEEAELELLAQRDIEALGCGEDGPYPAPLPGPAVRLFGAAEPQFRTLLPASLALDIGLTVLGTSWIAETRSVLERRSAPCAFLGALSDRGPQSLARLSHHLHHNAARERGLVTAFAELTRGALLGISDDLDSEWPAFLAMSPILKG